MTTHVASPTTPQDLERCWGCITVQAAATSEALDVALMVVARRIEVSTPMARCESCGRSTVLYRVR
jgi:hypothetical protein